MARWRIIDGPAKRIVRFDGTVWGCVIENTNDPAQRRFIGVSITRTVEQAEPTKLPIQIAEAIETKGLSVIEPYFDEREPPEMFIVSSAGISIEGNE